MNYTLFNCPLHLVLQVLIQALVHLRGRGGLVVHLERRTRGPGFEPHNHCEVFLSINIKLPKVLVNTQEALAPSQHV